MTIRLRRPLLAQVLLLGSFLGAFGFFGYYPILHTIELGEFCLIVLFLWLAISTRMDARWSLHFLLPALALAAFVLFYAYVFTVRMDAPLIPSILAQRYYAFSLLAPVTYVLYLRGWRLKDFQRVFVLAMVLTVVSRILADFTVTPNSLLLSGSFFELRLDEIYGELAYLIRRLDLSTLFLALYFGRRLAQARDPLSFALRSVFVVSSVALLLITIPRGLLASALLALIVYGVFLSRPGRARLSLVLLPLFASIVALSAPGLKSIFVDVFGQDISYVVRARSASIAWHSFLEHPLFGFGQDSSQSISYQDIFGKYFFPSDVGLLGVALQFGLLGLLSYLAFSAWLSVNLLKVLWSYMGKTKPEEWVFLWALYVVCLTLVINSPLQAKFIFGNGLPVAAFASGFLMAARSYGPSGNQRGHSRKRRAPASRSVERKARSHAGFRQHEVR